MLNVVLVFVSIQHLFLFPEVAGVFVWFVLMVVVFQEGQIPV